MNHAASQMLNFETAPGTQYYGKNSSGKLIFIRAFPWLEKLFNKFTAEENNEKSFKTTVSEENQYFFISFSRSLDISGKFSNTIVIIEDITKRKTMEKELEILATTDPLTGDINRRSFLDLFKKEFQRAKRYNHGLALLMMDIDNFKRINDNFGHGTGDKILKLLFATSSSILRESDIFGRWGGEEFIILLPETDLQKTSAAAERLRGALSKSELLTNDGSNNNFTVSIGFTLIENENAVIEEVIKKADKALYLAKKQGRNRAVYL